MFGPFGDKRKTGSSISELGFTGHHQNEEIGLIYMNARYYLPGLGRFASADSIIPDPMTPQTFNRYSYVNNNPINLTDPSGHKPVLGQKPADKRQCGVPMAACGPAPQKPTTPLHIPKPEYYDCKPTSNSFCIDPKTDPITAITQVIFGEGGSISLEMAANIMQVLMNKAQLYWECSSNSK